MYMAPEVETKGYDDKVGSFSFLFVRMLLKSSRSSCSG
jgi:hypothetical protein